jgi:hypothetical protein
MSSENFDNVVEDSRQSVNKEINRLLIYIPSGALVFTMGFMKDIIPDWEIADCVGLLKTSWILYTATVLTTLISHFIYHWVLKSFQKDTKKGYKLVVMYGSAPDWVTYFALFLLIIGMIFSLWFLLINI